MRCKTTVCVLFYFIHNFGTKYCYMNTYHRLSQRVTAGRSKSGDHSVSQSDSTYCSHCRLPQVQLHYCQAATTNPLDKVTVQPAAGCSSYPVNKISCCLTLDNLAERSTISCCFWSQRCEGRTAFIALTSMRETPWPRYAFSSMKEDVPFI